MATTRRSQRPKSNHLLVGLAGIVRHFFGGFKLWAFLSHVDLFKQHEILANLGLIALGAAIMIATDAMLKA